MLYTSETREAAIAERGFHLTQGQPIPLTRVCYEQSELEVSLVSGHALPELEAPAVVGRDTAPYDRMSGPGWQRKYPGSEDIYEACSFVRTEGLLVFSTRDKQPNYPIVIDEQSTHIPTDANRRQY